MKTTIEVPDELYRRAKAEAALRGRKLKDLVQEGLRLVLATPRDADRPQLAGLRKRAHGFAESGASSYNEASKLERLRRAVAAGFADIDKGHYVEVRSKAELRKLMTALGREASKAARRRK